MPGECLELHFAEVFLGQICSKKSSLTALCAEVKYTVVFMKFDKYAPLSTVKHFPICVDEPKQFYQKNSLHVTFYFENWFSLFWLDFFPIFPNSGFCFCNFTRFSVPMPYKNVSKRLILSEDWTEWEVTHRKLLSPTKWYQSSRHFSWYGCRPVRARKHE